MLYWDMTEVVEDMESTSYGARQHVVEKRVTRVVHLSHRMILPGTGSAGHWWHRSVRNRLAG